MRRDETLRRILDGGIVAVIRAESADRLVEAVGALAEGGVIAAEITFTIPDAVAAIRRVREAFGDAVVVGAGTVLDPEPARAAILAGAEFVVSPTFHPEVARTCRRYDTAAMLGAFTPTEILAAWEGGADVVKVFPAEVGGPGYFRAIRGPLPQIRLMPTGGVDLETAAEFLRAGACCLGVGGSLVDPEAVASGDGGRLRARAARFAEIVRAYREGRG